MTLSGSSSQLQIGDKLLPDTLPDEWFFCFALCVVSWLLHSLWKNYNYPLHNLWHCGQWLLHPWGASNGLVFAWDCNCMLHPFFYLLLCSPDERKYQTNKREGYNTHVVMYTHVQVLQLSSRQNVSVVVLSFSCYLVSLDWWGAAGVPLYGLLWLGEQQDPDV